MNFHEPGHAKHLHFLINELNQKIKYILGIKAFQKRNHYQEKLEVSQTAVESFMN